MGTRSHTTFKKRQKEMARLERQRDKAAKKAQRKLQAKLPPDSENPELDSENAEPGDETGLPVEPSGVTE